VGLERRKQFFEGKSAVQEVLRKITSKLQELGIDYAVAGGMALFSHGFRRLLADGVTLGPEGGTVNDYAYLITADPIVARKYDMHDESEFLEEEDEHQEG
jgi:hypothetical protein